MYPIEFGGQVNNKSEKGIKIIQTQLHQEPVKTQTTQAISHWIDIFPFQPNNRTTLWGLVQ